MKFALLVPRLDSYDAVARDVAGMATALRNSGHSVRIFAAGGSLKKLYEPVRKLKNIQEKSTVLIYHYAIAFEPGDIIYEKWPGPRILRFHNVTPPEFFDPYHEGIAEACRQGRNRLRLLPKPDILLSVSSFNASEYRQLSGLNPETEVLGPFHRIDRLLTSTERHDSFNRLYRGDFFRLLQVGRIVPNKDPVSALDFARELAEKYNKKVLLTFAGSLSPLLKKYNKILFEKIRIFQDSITVRFAQKVSQAELNVLIHSADFLTVPSLHEGFCLPALEAMACGTHVLANECGGLKEFVHSPLKTEMPFAQSALKRIDFYRANPDALLQETEEAKAVYHQRFRNSVLKQRLVEILKRRLNSRHQGRELSGDSDAKSLKKKKIALVVQRFGESFAGGSEKHCRAYAELLSREADVTVLTTNSLNNDTWQPERVHQEGQTDYQVKRFTVHSGRSRYWHNLVEKLPKLSEVISFEKKELFWLNQLRLYKLQSLWLQHQGPVCCELYDYLAVQRFDAVLFFTYLYETTLTGVLCTNTVNKAIVPTLHNEAPAYFLPVRLRMKRFNSVLYNTETEAELIKKAWNLKSKMLQTGYPVSVQKTDTAQGKRIRIPESAYFLYAGRIDRNKGIFDYLNIIKEFRHHFALPVRVILTGSGNESPANYSFVDFRGFVSEEEKNLLIRNAAALLQPSENESLSIVTLESFILGTPVITNERSEVVASHIRQTGFGWICKNPFEIIVSMEQALRSGKSENAAKARHYAESNYGPEIVNNQLRKAML